MVVVVVYTVYKVSDQQSSSRMTLKRRGALNSQARNKSVRPHSSIHPHSVNQDIQQSNTRRQDHAQNGQDSQEAHHKTHTIDRHHQSRPELDSHSSYDISVPCLAQASSPAESPTRGLSTVYLDHGSTTRPSRRGDASTWWTRSVSIGVHSRSRRAARWRYKQSVGQVAQGT